MKEFSEELLAAASALGGERKVAGRIYFPAPPPTGFQDWGLSKLGAWEDCIEARFASGETKFGFSVFPCVPTIFSSDKHLGNQPRPAIIANLSHFLPGVQGDLDIHPEFSPPEGKTRPAMAVIMGDQVVYSLKNPQAPRLVHAHPLLTADREEVREAVRQAAGFFHRFAEACDLNAFPWSADARLRNTMQDLRRSLGEPAQPGSRRQSVQPALKRGEVLCAPPVNAKPFRRAPITM